MSKFVYRMQNILNLKYKLEEQAKLDFAAARKRLDDELEKLDILFGRKAAYEEEGLRLREKELNVQDILDNKNAILQMDDYILLQKVEVSRAEEELEAERRKLQEIMQERQVQEKLREKAFECLPEPLGLTGPEREITKALIEIKVQLSVPFQNVLDFQNALYVCLFRHQYGQRITCRFEVFSDGTLGTCLNGYKYDK